MGYNQEGFLLSAKKSLELHYPPWTLKSSFKQVWSYCSYQSRDVDTPLLQRAIFSIQTQLDNWEHILNL